VTLRTETLCEWHGRSRDDWYKRHEETLINRDCLCRNHGVYLYLPNMELIRFVSFSRVWVEQRVTSSRAPIRDPGRCDHRLISQITP